MSLVYCTLSIVQVNIYDKPLAIVCCHGRSEHFSESLGSLRFAEKVNRVLRRRSNNHASISTDWNLFWNDKHCRTSVENDSSWLGTIAKVIPTHSVGIVGLSNNYHNELSRSSWMKWFTFLSMARHTFFHERPWWKLMGPFFIQNTNDVSKLISKPTPKLHNQYWYRVRLRLAFRN
jgi:hypothetical protein